ncbi:membrane cofactor protein isoform X2 [Perognathus longimembris pacificus]|uniref:membrane cofactor protein isoform X2 n=1 Tax=Perognathus longimembris pacificus TaxID=214514 RepID=UPI0020190156|nr:membrane cofactor protein isoform X2 [Perognathus longimembris pacificus]
MTGSAARGTEPACGGATPGALQPCVLGTVRVAVAFLLLLFSGGGFCEKPDTCEPPPTFEGMEPLEKFKPSYKVGEEVLYKCKRGYSVVFSLPMATTCDKNLTWTTIRDIICGRNLCNTLQNPESGWIYYPSGTWAWGNQAHFVCKQGYYLIGPETLHCTLNKDAEPVWSETAPRCEKILCTPPPKIKNGTHTFTDIDVFNFREAVTYSCDQLPGPDQFSLVGQKMLYCAGNGVWSSDPPECKVVKCPFPILLNGEITSGFEKNFSYQATITIECKEGFYHNGTNTFVCSGNSTWDPPIPSCHKGSRPTHPKKPLVYKYPGYPEPRGGLFDQELDAWIIALIILIFIVSIAIVCLCLYRFLDQRKKGVKPSKSSSVALEAKSSRVISTPSTQKVSNPE